MAGLKSHIFLIRHIVLLWVVLFALSPCTVKAFYTATADYTVPLNKAKALSSSKCVYAQTVSSRLSHTLQIDVDKQEGSFGTREENLANKRARQPFTYAKNSSGSSPPKYILYKCLKIDLV